MIEKKNTKINDRGSSSHRCKKIKNLVFDDHKYLIFYFSS